MFVKPKERDGSEFFGFIKIIMYQLGDTKRKAFALIYFPIQVRHKLFLKRVRDLSILMDFLVVNYIDFRWTVTSFFKNGEFRLPDQGNVCYLSNKHANERLDKFIKYLLRSIYFKWTFILFRI